MQSQQIISRTLSTAYIKWNLLNVVHSFPIIINKIFRKLVRKVNKLTKCIEFRYRLYLEWMSHTFVFDTFFDLKKTIKTY